MRITTYNSVVISGMLHFTMVSLLFAVSLPGIDAGKRLTDISLFFPDSETETQPRHMSSLPGTAAVRKKEASSSALPRTATSVPTRGEVKGSVPAAYPAPAAPGRTDAPPPAAVRQEKSGETGERKEMLAAAPGETRSSAPSSSSPSPKGAGSAAASGAQGHSAPLPLRGSDERGTHIPGDIKAGQRETVGGNTDGVDLSALAGGFSARIESAKWYPYMARRKGIEGTVVVKVKIGRDGSLSEATVLRSSGHGILDESALSLVKKVCPFRHSAGRDISIEVPITYRLAEG
ncbi:MAG: energy transducer TonB [Alphaproteobacteria bacterium]|uniref:Energy transducer TonB n=1 Tax=Candidatus Nitrobium versatile TaxID=2884831 RepID=A0A953M2N7_9BACT|nr:energy transducer TonB [Candidatus Nitrobium versatile]